MPESQTRGLCNRHPVEFRIWKDMKRRCYNQNRSDYGRYGGRGIFVCSRWRDSFANFLADMGPRPTPKHSLDRKRNKGPYSPGNCRWATPQEQQRNTRRSRRLTIDGVSRTVAEWSEVVGVSAKVIEHRINAYGWDESRAVKTPVDVSRGKRHGNAPVMSDKRLQRELIRRVRDHESITSLAERYSVPRRTLARLVKVLLVIRDKSTRSIRH